VSKEKELEKASMSDVQKQSALRSAGGPVREDTRLKKQCEGIFSQKCYAVSQGLNRIAKANRAPNLF
jgi:hypothetical protein